MLRWCASSSAAAATRASSSPSPTAQPRAWPSPWRRSPGVIGLDILDNVIPFIPKEEGKVEVETKKILGALQADGTAISSHDVKVSCTCTRVAVLEGHTESVF